METNPHPPIHGSAFSHNGMGCLIVGPSGAGKSRLVTEAILYGAHLIADDRVKLCTMSGRLVARSVPNLCGVLELRGLGLIKVARKKADKEESHPIHLIIELDPAADERLPEFKTYELLGIAVPYLKVKPFPHTSAASILLYLQAMQEGRILPPDWHPTAA